VWMEKQINNFIFSSHWHLMSKVPFCNLLTNPKMVTCWESLSAWPMRGWRWPPGSVVFLVGKDFSQKFNLLTVICQCTLCGGQGAVLLDLLALLESSFRLG
jgi:hypothetical protein